MKQTNKLPVIEEAILKNLPVGADNPKKTETLAKEVGLSVRTLRAFVRRLVVKYHIPITATREDGGGYFIPRNLDELNKGLLPLMSQHKREGERITALLNADLESYKAYLGEEV